MKITAIYDNGGKTADRYTIITDAQSDKRNHDLFDALGTDDEGGKYFSQWCSARPGRHLGRLIHFEDLSESVQRHIVRRIFG